MISATPSSVQMMLFDEPAAMPRGRFQVKSTVQAAQAISDMVAAELRNNRDSRSVSRLVTMLERLTVVQLHELKQSHKMKASGRTKAELVAKLANRLDRGRRADFSASPKVELTPKEQEQELVRNLQAGVDGAFDCLYERYSSVLRSDLMRRGVATRDVEDVVQETFLRVSQVINTLNPAKSLIGFLKTIASRIAIDLNRRAVRRGKGRTASLDCVEEQGASFESEYPAEDQSAQFTMVMTVLEEQPETTKEIIRLYFFEQMTYQQIADQFGLGVTTVKDRVRKAIGVVQQRVMASCGE